MLAATPNVPQITPIVTLKLHGRPYACEKKRCKSKNFRALVQTDLEGPDLLVYQCAVCSTERRGGEGSGLEELTPQRNDWRTPNELWQQLHREYRFNVDAAADEKNRKCSLYFGPENGADPDAVVPPWADGLKRNWHGDDVLARQNYLRVDAGFRGTVRHEDVRVWLNPPYNPKGSVETWLKQAIEQAGEGVFSVMLIPMSSSVAWFNDLVIPFAEWHTFRGRIAFDDPAGIDTDKRTSPKQDNLLVIFDPRSERVGHTAVRDSKTGMKLWERT